MRLHQEGKVLGNCCVTIKEAAGLIVKRVIRSPSITVDYLLPGKIGVGL